MKSKTLKRCIAIMLCMVIVLSGSGYLLAESLQEGRVETEVQPEDEAVVEEAADDGTVEVEVQNAEEEQLQENAEEEEEKLQENAEAPAQEDATSETEEQVAETPAEETPVEVVAGQATSITKEIKDANGNIICTVVADVPEGAFNAKPSELEMTVDALTNTEEENVGKLIEGSLAENTYVENCVMYRVTFKVNGTDTEPSKSVDVNFKGTNLEVADDMEANVFYFASAKSESGIDKDTLVEIPQREAKMQELLDAGTGKTREQLEEENDFSELTVQNGVASELKMEVRRNRIYGCYTTAEQKDSSDTSETAGGSEGAREVTLYAQWRKDYVPQVTTTKKLSHEKYIKKNEDGSYDLTLNVSGAVGTEEYANKLDVLFVLDTSGSMDKKMEDDGKTSTRFKLQNKAVKAAVENLSQKKGVDARFAIVSFDTMAGVNSKWTKSASGLSYPSQTSNYSGKAPSYNWWSWQSGWNVPAGGTNYQEGLKRANSLLATSRGDATKIVVFLSDGDPTFYTNDDGTIGGNGSEYDATAMSKATTVLQSMTNMQYFYTVGVGPKDSYEHLKDLRDGVPSGVTTKNFDGTDAKKLKDAFDSIIIDTTTLLCTDVTITDTLSEYVELVDTNVVPNVVVKAEDGKQIERLKDDKGVGYAVSHFLEAKILTEDGKTKVQLQTKNGYKLEAGYTYYVTVKIQPTDKAVSYYVTNHDTYPNTGDKNTDENTGSDKKPGKDTRNDGSSSEKSGFYSNEAATVTYTYNGKQSTEAYKKPVVQVETISVEKRWVGTKPENESVFVALLKNGKVVQDSSNQNAPRILTLNKANEWKGNFAVAKVTNDYTVKELRQDESGTISYKGQKYSVVEDQGIVTIAGLTYKTVYSTEVGNPARIITNVENSKKIKIIKTSTNSDDIMLDGAEFTLVDSNGNPVILGENTTNTYTSVNGVVLEAGLNAGTYTLTEIKAPSGYMKLETPIEFVITSDVKLNTQSDKVSIEKVSDAGAGDVWIIKVKDEPLYDLPETGGIGIFWYTIGGMLLMMAAALILYKRKCREVLDK